MADIIKRIWRSGPRQVKRVAWGYTLQVQGKQVRKFNSAWTEDDAQKALAAVLLDRDAPPPEPVRSSGMTLGEAIERFALAKARNRTVRRQQYELTRCFLATWGASTSLGEITAGRIAAWREAMLAARCPRTGEPYAAATINRPLAALRALLNLAAREWEAIPAAPVVRKEREPEGRIRWLTADEEARLRAACRQRLPANLLPVVTMASETGMRKGELLGLTWDRVDMSRGVLRLDVTKTTRREVPMRQAVYDLLAARAHPREGVVWRGVGGIDRAFREAVEAAGVDDFHFHDLRHHFASWFMMRGGSIYALSKILGHSKITMTTRYAHLAPDHLRAEMERTERGESVSTHAQHMAPGAVTSGV